MAIEIKIPTVGESVTEVTIASWMKSDGDYVEMDEAVCEIESDKASMELPAPEAGVLSIKVEEGETVDVGSVVGTIDPSAEAPKKEVSEDKSKNSTEKESDTANLAHQKNQAITSPAAGKILREKGVDPESVSGTGKDGRVTKGDALKAENTSLKKSEASSIPELAPAKGSREVRRQKMSALRKTIAKRLVEAKQTTAMLTTFNEVDMSEIMSLRKKYKESFKEKHNIGLGFMSFFTKATCMALRDFPAVNGQIDGNEIVFHDYADIGIAVSTPKGLVVPVVRSAHEMNLAEIESSIMNLALRARDGKLGIDEMQGGTFTITNGGVFGSMLSTPIINTPQSAILGMHNIVERPVAVNGQVEIRPVMYIALSYDHRIIDGRESVSFLKRIKELIEDPSRLLLDV